MKSVAPSCVCHSCRHGAVVVLGAAPAREERGIMAEYYRGVKLPEGATLAPPGSESGGLPPLTVEEIEASGITDNIDLTVRDWQRQGLCCDVLCCAACSPVDVMAPETRIGADGL